MERRPRVLVYGIQGSCDNYCRALAAAGMEAVVSTEKDAAAEGLLLPGGGDIFGDALPVEEYQFIARFAEDRRPILGICRGMQALNVFFGGTLYDRVPGHQIPGEDMVHPTCAMGLLAQLLTTSPVVTSSHHQAVRAVGRELTVCQWSTDGIPEGICHTSLPIVGVQYHPERQSFALARPDAADGAPLFCWLREQCRKRRVH